MRNVTDEEIEFEEFRKRPVVVEAKKMEESFVVDTLEGADQHGDAGDYLVEGIEGERYPVDQDIFEETYNPVRKTLTETDSRFIELDWKGDIAGDIAEVVEESLPEKEEEFKNKNIAVQSLHIEVEEGKMINGVEVVILGDNNGD